MLNKIKLASNGCKGNLVHYNQNYIVYYLQKELRNDEILCDKISLELIMPSSNGEAVVKSYFMPEPSNVNILIIDLFKGLMKLEKERGTLNMARVEYLAYSFNKLIKDLGIKALHGEYDKGI
jgi:hypothetical protein